MFLKNVTEWPQNCTYLWPVRMIFYLYWSLRFKWWQSLQFALVLWFVLDLIIFSQLSGYLVWLFCAIIMLVIFGITFRSFWYRLLLLLYLISIFSSINSISVFSSIKRFPVFISRFKISSRTFSINFKTQNSFNQQVVKHYKRFHVTKSWRSKWSHHFSLSSRLKHLALRLKAWSRTEAPEI